MACEEWQAHNDPEHIPSPQSASMEAFFGDDPETLDRIKERKRNRIARRTAQRERTRGRGVGRTMSF